MKTFPLPFKFRNLAALTNFKENLAALQISGKFIPRQANPSPDYLRAYFLATTDADAEGLRNHTDALGIDMEPLPVLTIKVKLGFKDEANALAKKFLLMLDDSPDMHAIIEASGPHYLDTRYDYKDPFDAGVDVSYTE